MMNKTLSDLPLWAQRIALVMLGPILLLIALFSALCEGWKEFVWELEHAWADVVTIWKGER